MRLPKPILGKLIVIYSYQQRYKIFLVNKKNPPNFFGGLTETLRRSVLGNYQGKVIY